MYVFDGDFTRLASIIDAEEDLENLVIVDNVEHAADYTLELIHFHRHDYCYRTYGYYFNSELTYICTKEPIDINEV